MHTTEKEAISYIERLNKLATVKGVVAVMADGRPVHSTLGEADTKVIAAAAVGCCRGVESSMAAMPQTEEPRFVRIRTANHTIMIAKENDYILIALCDDKPAAV